MNVRRSTRLAAALLLTALASAGPSHAQSQLPQVDLPGPPQRNQVIQPVPPNPTPLIQTPAQQQFQPPQGPTRRPNINCQIPAERMSPDLRAYCAAQP